MNKVFSKIFYIISICSFIFFSVRTYFSNDNIEYIIESRSQHIENLRNNSINLPLLKSDTNDIIEYTNNVSEYKNKKIKRKFWELIDN